jgi:hypothetical protein
MLIKILLPQSARRAPVSHLAGESRPSPSCKILPLELLFRPEGANEKNGTPSAITVLLFRTVCQSGFIHSSDLPGPGSAPPIARLSEAWSFQRGGPACQIGIQNLTGPSAESQSPDFRTPRALCNNRPCSQTPVADLAQYPHHRLCLVPICFSHSPFLPSIFPSFTAASKLSRRLHHSFIPVDSC